MAEMESGPAAATGGEIVSLLLREVAAMTHYAFGAGIPLPADLLNRLSLLEQGPAPAISDLARLHTQLAGLVAPASPRTILLLAEDKYAGRFLSSFGPLPNIRRLLAAALFFLLCFLVASLSEHINATTIRQDIYTIDSGHLLHVLAFLISAAGLGACFNALSTAYRYVQAGTYDPRLDSSYWIRIVLGIIAGLLISQLVPLDGTGAAGPMAPGTDGDVAPTLGKPLLALLGGYSANMVNSVLQRLVETVQAMFKGSASEALAAQESILRARADFRVEQHKLSLAGGVMGLRQAIQDGADSNHLLAMASRLAEQVTPGGTPAPTVERAE